MQTTMTTNETRYAATSEWTEMPTITTKEADNTALDNTSTNWNIYTTTANTTSVSTMLSYLSQSTNSPSTERNSSSDTIAETKKEVTTFPAESFFSNSVYQSTVEDPKATTSAITSSLIVQVSTSMPLISSKLLASISSNKFQGSQKPVCCEVVSSGTRTTRTQSFFPNRRLFFLQLKYQHSIYTGGGRLKNSEAILTISFAILLALTILGFAVYIFNKFRKRRDQYSHHPLYDTSSEAAERYTIPEDVLVISGGLYDAPRIYNPNMVNEDDEFTNDYLPFSVQPGQLKLEFLSGEKEQDIFPAYETFQKTPGDL